MKNLNRGLAPSRLALWGAALALVCALQSGCGLGLIAGAQGLEPKRERVVRESSEWCAPKLLVIDVFGTIGLESTSDLLGLSFSQGQTSRVAEELDAARGDSSIKAVLIRINSPGGGVTASDVIHNEIMRYKEETGVKVYAYMLDVAASGGYYVAMSADSVSALPTSITGSIGVIASFPLIKKLAEWAGYEQRVIASGENKDMGSAFEEFTPEQRQILQSTIDEMYERFLEIVAAGRPKLDKEKLRQLADGRVYTAMQAQREGLIDHIEFANEILDRIEADLGAEPTIVTYGPGLRSGNSLYRAETPAELLGTAGGSGVSIPSEIRLKVGVDGANDLKPGFYYLWAR